jgi:hypothetical protein
MLGCGSFQNSDRADEDGARQPISRVTQGSAPDHLDRSTALLDCSYRDDLRERGMADEREFYLRKFKEIEHLMEDWNCQRSSGELMEHIRRIILVPAGVQWTVEGGEFVGQPDSSFLREDIIDN